MALPGAVAWVTRADPSGSPPYDGGDRSQPLAAEIRGGSLAGLSGVNSHGKKAAAVLVCKRAGDTPAKEPTRPPKRQPPPFV